MITLIVVAAKTCMALGPQLPVMTAYTPLDATRLADWMPALAKAFING